MLALDLHRRARLPLEARDGLPARQGLGEEELQRHLLVELEVVRGDDHAHAPDAEDALDAILAGEDGAGLDAGDEVGGMAHASLRID